MDLDRGDFMSSVRDGYNRFDPDATLNGFFPFWGIMLLLVSCKFLFFTHYACLLTWRLF